MVCAHNFFRRKGTKPILQATVPSSLISFYSNRTRNSSAQKLLASSRQSPLKKNCKYSNVTTVLLYPIHKSYLLNLCFPLGIVLHTHIHTQTHIYIYISIATSHSLYPTSKKVFYEIVDLVLAPTRDSYKSLPKSTLINQLQSQASRNPLTSFPSKHNHLLEHFEISNSRNGNSAQ